MSGLLKETAGSSWESWWYEDRLRTRTPTHCTLLPLCVSVLTSYSASVCLSFPLYKNGKKNSTYFIGSWRSILFFFFPFFKLRYSWCTGLAKKVHSGFSVRHYGKTWAHWPAQYYLSAFSHNSSETNDRIKRKIVLYFKISIYRTKKNQDINSPMRCLWLPLYS